jgi:DNA-directed RNA polymerase specialized sigma24 family protein
VTANDPLERVRRAAAAKTSADREFRSALAAARAAGSSYSAIAVAAGVSRQAVRQLLERAAAKTAV